MSLSNSPFANRLHSNYVPWEPEILEKRDFMDPAEELARIYIGDVSHTYAHTLTLDTHTIA
ncbi:hypothetical protein K438DRAFT_1954985 [Mycena galopus ATCC 62051]|nr:hypothetical protein K438DRAFT_1954985 [Mycena galopus ATCC 62051]